MGAFSALGEVQGKTDRRKEKADVGEDRAACPQLLGTPRSPSALEEEQGKIYHPYLINEEIIAQRGAVTCLRSHSKRSTES